MTRNYSIKIFGSNVLIDNAAAAPDRTHVIGVGEFGTIINRNAEAIWNIARHMRVRPEAVFQMLSDAFDESLSNGTMLVEDGCLRFECEVAAITLDPGEDGRSWELKRKGKEAMYCADICRHPKNVFHIVPGNLSGSNVMFPHKSIDCLVTLAVGLDESSPAELVKLLNLDYHRALRERTFAYDGSELTLCFKTCFCAANGQAVYAMLEPHYYDPIPNTWKISRFWCAEDHT